MHSLVATNPCDTDARRPNLDSAGSVPILTELMDSVVTHVFVAVDIN